MNIDRTSSPLRELAAYGVNSALLLQERAKEAVVDYLDLIPGGGGRDGDEQIFPEVVAENRGRPLLYIVNRASLSADSSDYVNDLKRLRRVVGSRGDRAYLGIIEPGQLSVIPVSLASELPRPSVYRSGTAEALTFFPRLAMGEYAGEGEPSKSDYVYHAMFDLLEHAADELADQFGISGPDVLSMVGRALFFRFLCDRGIVKASSLRTIAPSAPSLVQCFADAETAAATCSWLDATFNGHFLPLITDEIPSKERQKREALYLKFFRALGSKGGTAAYSHLSAILHGHEPAGGGYQLTFAEEWAKFDFAHVPVGLLSQVYEAFSWKWVRDARETSVHYTPRGIADYLIEEAFFNLRDGHQARVLDPACGAGVFLVLAFRKLYERLWKSQGKRPDTKAIRTILETQLAGFDVSESALRLAGLSLYLTAIELDPEPVPPSKLQFKNLRNLVLFNFRRETDPEKGPIMGSLSAGPEHNASYDLVLCNPPWTHLKAGHDALANSFTQVSRSVIEKRDGIAALASTYENPDRVPDLPFVWRSTEWCRPNGRIGLVLPGRNLFKQSDDGSKARDVLLRGLEVTGILNCANLSDTKVWPEMNQPFFLLFACNRSASPSTVFRWVTPQCDVALNRRGEIRIDSESIHPVSLQAMLEEPWLWKALTIGTSLDVNIVRKIKNTPRKTLVEYWNSLGLEHGNGYQTKAKQPKQDSAEPLWGVPHLLNTAQFRFSVDVSQLDPFKTKQLFRPRTRDLYRAPLVLVRTFPKEDRACGCALLATEDVIFNESFDGFSCYGHPKSSILAKYLHLFIHSSVWQHYVLLTAPKMGVERREFYLSDLEEVPFIPLDELSEEKLASIKALSGRLLREDFSVFDEIDSFFAGLYGLSAADAEVIRDTLSVALPYGKTRARACTAPTPESKTAFAHSVALVLRPFLKRYGKRTNVALIDQTSVATGSPYELISVTTDEGQPQLPKDFLRDEILPLASKTGASRMIMETGNALIIAVLNQQRYWTKSRARLCAAEIINNHLDVLKK
jgi:hypothetical protein